MKFTVQIDLDQEIARLPDQEGAGVSFKRISAYEASGLAIEYGDEDLMVYSPAVANFEANNGALCFIVGG